jgi:hypothetical protein
MVTVGLVADQPEREKKRRKKERQTTPKILESFILGAPIFVDQPNPTAPAEF